MVTEITERHAEEMKKRKALTGEPTWEIELTANTVRALLTDVSVKLSAVGSAFSNIPYNIVQYYKDKGNICKSNSCYTVVSYNIFKKQKARRCDHCEWWANNLKAINYKPSAFEEVEKELSTTVTDVVNDIFKKTDDEFQTVIKDTEGKYREAIDVTGLGEQEHTYIPGLHLEGMLDEIVITSSPMAIEDAELTKCFAETAYSLNEKRKTIEAEAETQRVIQNAKMLLFKQNEKEKYDKKHPENTPDNDLMNKYAELGQAMLNSASAKEKADEIIVINGIRYRKVN